MPECIRRKGEPMAPAERIVSLPLTVKDSPPLSTSRAYTPLSLKEDAVHRCATSYGEVEPVSDWV